MAVFSTTCPKPFPAEGWELPVHATYGGIRRLPLMFSHNKFNPKLIFHPDRIEYRILRTKRKVYTDIYSVDVSRTLSLWGKFYLLTFNFKATIFNLKVNIVDNPDTIQDALEFLKEQGVVLTPLASLYLSQKQ